MKGKQHFFLLLIAFQITSCSLVDQQKLDSSAVLKYLKNAGENAIYKPVYQLDAVLFKEVEKSTSAEKNFEKVIEKTIKLLKKDISIKDAEKIISDFNKPSEKLLNMNNDQLQKDKTEVKKEKKISKTSLEDKKKTKKVSKK